MHRYFIKTPFLIRWLFPKYTWKEEGDAVYLTFDDGPHPQITPWVLDLLNEFNVKATFFCIGRNVMLYPEVYQRIINEGHSVGNHTYNHVNGWKTDTASFIKEVEEAEKVIKSSLFRTL